MEKPSVKKLSKVETAEIGSRMYENALRHQQRMEQKIKKRNEEKAIAGLGQCTLKPNLNKDRFVKYPRPPPLSKGTEGISVSFAPDGYQPIKYIDKINKHLNNDHLKVQKTESRVKPAFLSKVSTLYNWKASRQQKGKEEFLKMELSKSCETLHHSRSKQRSRMAASRILNGSLENIRIKGTEEFQVRQQKADILKRQRKYLQKFPNSYVWTYKQKFESSVDSVPTHYLSFGEGSRYRR